MAESVWEDLGYKPLQRRVVDPDENEYTLFPGSDFLGYEPREMSRPATKQENINGLRAARQRLRLAS